jgi:hypothetical protein
MANLVYNVFASYGKKFVQKRGSNLLRKPKITNFVIVFSFAMRKSRVANKPIFKFYLSKMLERFNYHECHFGTFLA